MAQPQANNSLTLAPNSVALQPYSIIPGLVAQALYEDKYPWPQGSRPAGKPSMTGDARGIFTDAWQDARVRIQPQDFPVFDAVSEKFARENNGKRLTRAAYRAWQAKSTAAMEVIRENDEQKAAEYRANPGDLPFWPPVYPLPYDSDELNDIARPQRRWVLCFSDLRSMARALNPVADDPNADGGRSFLPPVGEARDARLRAVRFVQVTWLDDARYPVFAQPAAKSEWAFEAMQALALAAPKMHKDLMIRIYFVSHYGGENGHLNIDSPGIYHLRQVRCKKLLLPQRPIYPSQQCLPKPLQKQIIKEVEGKKPFKPCGTELTHFKMPASFTGILDVARLNANGNHRRLATRLRRQMALMDRKYKSMHHRRNVGRRWFSYHMQKVRKVHRNLVASGASALELADAQKEVDAYEVMRDELDGYWCKKDIQENLASRHGKSLPFLRWEYSIYPEEISQPLVHEPRVVMPR